MICDCQPVGGDECVNDCVNDVADQIQQIPAACLACINDHRDRCLSLEAECFQGPCDMDDEPVPGGPDEPNPEPPVIVDAGVDSF